MTSQLFSDGGTRDDAHISALLSKSIDEALDRVLGPRAKDAVFAHFERRGIPKDQIPKSLSKFDAFLEDTFGRGGRAIQREIVKQFYGQLGLEVVEGQNCALTDYVDLASQRLARPVDVKFSYPGAA